MVKVVGVRFREAGKVYYFSPGDLEISENESVIVETVRGVEYGDVVIGIKEVDESKTVVKLPKRTRLSCRKTAIRKKKRFKYAWRKSKNTDCR